MLGILDMLVSELQNEGYKFLLGELVLKVNILGVVEWGLLDLIRAKQLCRHIFGVVFIYSN